MSQSCPLKKVDDYRWKIEKTGGMHTEGLIFASEKMVSNICSDNAYQQVSNVATLPGIVGYSLAMPDIHWGYGFPIGGVAAFQQPHVDDSRFAKCRYKQRQENIAFTCFDEKRRTDYFERY